MEIVVSIIEAIGAVVGSCVWAWAIVNICGIISKTYLVSECDMEPERLKDWIGLEIKKKKSGSL